MKKSAHQIWKESKEQNLSKEEFKQLLLKEKVIMKTLKKVEIEPDYCLCQCDCEKALNENNIPFKKDCGDIYVGMLEDVVGDDD